MKNSNDTIWNRTSDLPICSTVPNIEVMYENNTELWNHIQIMGLGQSAKNL